MAHPEHLVVGTIGGAVGLKGEVEVLVVSDDPNRFARGSTLLLGGGKPLTVRSHRRHGDRTVVAFEEVTDRSGAESIRGAQLLIAVADARELDAGEYWDHDLVGCDVITTEGTRVGVVSDVLHQPASEVLVVEAEGKEVLIPLIKAVVKSVDPRRTITVDPPPGLLE